MQQDLVIAEDCRVGRGASMREDSRVGASSVSKSVIPHVIHYCWFGGAPKPQLVLDCIASWRRFMPDWEVVEWNESNYDVTKCAYAEEAYANGKWAFVSDYARFDVLQVHGGVYFDTDVELLKPIPGWVLEDEAFAGMEASGLVSPGLVFGCASRLAVLSDIVESYDHDHFAQGRRKSMQTVNQRVTAILERQGFRRTEVIQRVAGITVYPSEYFCGYDQDIHAPRITENTISRHHYAHTWGGASAERKLRTQRFIISAIGESRYRVLLAVKRRYFGVHGA